MTTDPAKGVDIIIVNEVPFMRLGIASLFSTLEYPADCTISLFATAWDARKAIEEASSGGVLILDVSAWLSLQTSQSMREVEQRKLFDDKLSCAVVATEMQLRLCRLSSFGLDDIILADAEFSDFEKMAQNLISDRRSSSDRRVKNIINKFRLSERQMTILELMAEGLLTKTIASNLDIHESTVKCHVSNILKRLNCTRRVDAVRKFVQIKEDEKRVKSVNIHFTKKESYADSKHSTEASISASMQAAS